MRFVNAPKSLVENVVEECCRPTSNVYFHWTQPLTYVPSPTVYSKKAVISNATGNAAIFPSPAMFYEKKTNREFFYFAFSLSEISCKVLDI